MDGNLIEEIVSGDMVEVVMGVNPHQGELCIMLGEFSYIVDVRPSVDQRAPLLADDEVG